MARPTLHKAATAVVLLACLLLGPLPAQARRTLPGEMVGIRLSFSNGDVQLEGMLYAPVTSVSARFPTVVIVPDASPRSREAYEADAEMLVWRRFAAFIWDQRGTGGSTGDWRTASADELIGDALAAVEQLRTQRLVDPEQIGVLGAGQNGWLVPRIAAQSAHVAFVIKVARSPEVARADVRALYASYLAWKGAPESATRVALRALRLAHSAGRLPLRLGLVREGADWYVDRQPVASPAGMWDGVSVPALAIYGSVDGSYPEERELAALKAAWAEDGHPLNAVVIPPYPDPYTSGSYYAETIGPHDGVIAAWLRGIDRGEPQPELLALQQSGTAEPWPGSAPTRWTESAAVHLPLGIALALACLGALAVGWRLPAVRSEGTGARLLLGLMGAVGLAVLVGLAIRIGEILRAPAAPPGAWLRLLGWASLALTAALTALTVRSARKLTAGCPIYGAAALAGLILALLLDYWGVLWG